MKLWKITLCCSVLVLSLFAISPVQAADDPIEVTIDKKLDEVFESKQTRYKREQAEADRQEKLKGDIRWQEEQIKKQQAEIEKRKAVKGRSGSGAYTSFQAQPKASTINAELFVSSNCPKCGQMEAYLREVGVPYTLYRVDQDSKAEQDYLTNIGRGEIPVVRVNRQVVRGYKPEEVRKMIQEQKQAGQRSPNNVGGTPSTGQHY